MIHDKRLPPIVCIFLQAGYSLKEGSEPMGPKDMFPQDLAGFCHRFQEMDVMSDRYAGHIINEILPFVTETHNIHISQDPAKRCMCGQSSAAVARPVFCMGIACCMGVACTICTDPEYCCMFGCCIITMFDGRMKHSAPRWCFPEGIRWTAIPLPFQSVYSCCTPWSIAFLLLQKYAIKAPTRPHGRHTVDNMPNNAKKQPSFLLAPSQQASTKCWWHSS